MTQKAFLRLSARQGSSHVLVKLGLACKVNCAAHIGTMAVVANQQINK